MKLSEGLLRLLGAFGGPKKSTADVSSGFLTFSGDKRQTIEQQHLVYFADCINFHGSRIKVGQVLIN